MMYTRTQLQRPSQTDLKPVCRRPNAESVVVVFDNTHLVELILRLANLDPWRLFGACALNTTFREVISTVDDLVTLSLSRRGLTLTKTAVVNITALPSATVEKELRVDRFQISRRYLKTCTMYQANQVAALFIAKGGVRERVQRLKDTLARGRSFYKVYRPDFVLGP